MIRNPASFFARDAWTKLRARRNNRHLIPCAIFFLALILRAIFAFQWHATPYGAVPILDAELYHKAATQIADGSFLRATAFYQSPLYPYLLAIPYALFGASPVVATIFNLLMDAASCALIALIGLTLFGPAAGLLAGSLAAIDRQMIFSTAPVMKESLGTLLLVLFLLSFTSALRKGSALRHSGIAGFLLGLAALARGNVLFLIPGCLFLIARRGDAKRKRSMLSFMLALFLAVLPATFHNAVASHSFVPINYTDGFNLYLGHFPEADGLTYRFPAGIASGPEQEEYDVSWIASRAMGRQASPAEISAFWRKKAMEAIRQNPAHEAQLMGNKLFGLWNNGENFDNYDLPFIEAEFGTLLRAPLGTFAWLALLAPVGAVLAAIKRKDRVLALALLAACYAASLVAFYVTGRYRQPLTIFLFPLAGAALPFAWQALRQNKVGSVTLAVLLAAFSLGLSLWPRPQDDLRAYDWGLLSLIQAQQGNNADSVAATERALTLSPTEAGITAYVQGAASLHKLGRTAEAMALLKKGATVFPSDGHITYEIARLMAATNDTQGAIEKLKETVTLAPTNVLALTGLARLLAAQGRLDEAKPYATRGLALAPGNMALRKIIGDTASKNAKEKKSIDHIGHF